MTETAISSDLRTRAVAATEAVYRVSGHPAFDAALKAVLRKQATEFLGGLTGILLFTELRRVAERERLMAISASIRELVRFAASSGFVSGAHAERIANAYGVIADYLSEITVAPARSSVVSEPVQPEAQPTAVAAQFVPNERQERILRHLASAGRAQISNIRELFSDACSEKTIQRDLWQLVDAGLISRRGDNRWTIYSPVVGASIGHS